MLRRIKKIQNVGQFRQSTPNRHQLEKVTWVYGMNTYGKSTLGEIFGGYQTGDATAIEKRRTLPANTDSQEVDLSFYNGATEGSSKYKDGTWAQAIPFGYRLEVFDDEFLHKNVFTARGIERTNKVAFSAFVLGTLGVTKAEEIEKKNEKKTDLTKEVNRVKKALTSLIENFEGFSLDEFLALDVQKAIEEIKEAGETEKQALSKLEQEHKAVEAIMKRDKPQLLTWEHTVIDTVQALNGLLQSSLKEIHQEALDRIDGHIESAFVNTDDSEKTWLQTGSEKNNGEICNFCGQILSDDAKGLIKSYQEVFNDSYYNYLDFLNNSISINIEKIEDKKFLSDLNNSMNINDTAFKQYEDIDSKEIFDDLSAIISSLKDEISIRIKDFIFFYDDLIKSSKEKSSDKIKSVLSEIQQVSLVKFIEQNEIIVSKINEYNQHMEEIVSLIDRFVQRVNQTNYVEAIQSKKQELQNLKLEWLRVKHSGECDKFAEISGDLQVLTEEIPRMQRELDEEQSDYITNYFDGLNAKFQQFGSRNFTLEKAYSKQGNKPVYHLKVKLHGKNVAEGNLPYVFSESDRRALALAVFWTKLSQLSNGDKENTIVILDDPVTSFDSNRVSATHQAVNELSNHVRQVIVLSHYDKEISDYHRTFGRGHGTDYCLLEIFKNGDHSDLQKVEVAEFVKGQHEKARDAILAFVDRKTEVLNPNSLRVFYEYEIGLRFAKQLREHEINDFNLSDRIDNLNHHGVLSDDVTREAQQWREVLNPTHHTWLDHNVENWRNVAQRFMDFVYGELKTS